MNAFTHTEIPFASATRVPDGWRLLDDVELMDLPDPDFLIQSILARRGRAVLYGPSGSCKTTLVAGMLTCIATGREWFGHRVNHRGACAYVATEDVSGFKVRLRAAKAAAELSLSTSIGVYTFPEPIDLRDPVSITGFIRFMRETDVTLELVVIDTYAAATPGASENSSEDTTVAMAAALKIQEALTCAVMLVHHTNAGGTRERGHSSMRGAADTMISTNQIDDVIHIECSKQRNSAPFETLTLKLTPVPNVGGVVLRAACDVIQGAGLTPLQQKALDILREAAGADGITKTVWKAAIPDMQERAFYKVAKVLEEKRLVVKVGTTHFRAGGGR